jgi:hypothetical protein
MRGAQLQREHKFGRIQIDGDDRTRTGQPRALHRGKTDRLNR